MDRNINILQRGAEDGAVLGGVFIALIICSMQTVSALLSLLSLVLFIGVPVINYHLQRRTMRESGDSLPWSALWMEGILGFLGGGLMLAVVVYVFLRWISPDFVVRQATAAVEIYRQVPDFEPYADVISKMIEHHTLPTPIEMAISLLWSVGFSGSIVSMITAGIVKAATRQQRRS